MRHSALSWRATQVERRMSIKVHKLDIEMSIVRAAHITPRAKRGHSMPFRYIYMQIADCVRFAWGYAHQER